MLEWSAQTPMNPASTVKLLTTFAALDRLGPAYTWKTEIYGSGRTQGEVLQGDLIIKGYGDSKLTLERFWLLLRTIRQRGIRVIRGDWCSIAATSMYSRRMTRRVDTSPSARTTPDPMPCC